MNGSALKVTYPSHVVESNHVSLPDLMMSFDFLDTSTMQGLSAVDVSVTVTVSFLLPDTWLGTAAAAMKSVSVQARLGSAATEASGELLTDGSGEEPAPGVCGSPPPTELIAHHRNRATTTIPATTKARRFQYTAAGWSPTGCVSPSMVT